MFRDVPASIREWTVEIEFATIAWNNWSSMDILGRIDVEVSIKSVFSPSFSPEPREICVESFICTRV
jgi:hypothetical protein